MSDHLLAELRATAHESVRVDNIIGFLTRALPERQARSARARAAFYAAVEAARAAGIDADAIADAIDEGATMAAAK